jgi:hypothetical protein
MLKPSNEFLIQQLRQEIEELKKRVAKLEYNSTKKEMVYAL